MSNFKEKFEYLISSSNHIQKEASQISLEIFTTLAKIDHILFKVHGYQGVFSDKTVELSDHTTCRLGKWYQKEGRENFAKTSSYKNLEAPHKEIHEEINNALACIQSGECLNDINYVLSLFKNAEEASKKVFESLNNMLKEKG
ncbi:CZB domain-containing protein [Sulfurospirillum sp. 1307]